eukprot:gene9453-biopygen10730
MASTSISGPQIPEKCPLLKSIIKQPYFRQQPVLLYSGVFVPPGGAFRFRSTFLGLLHRRPLHGQRGRGQAARFGQPAAQRVEYRVRRERLWNDGQAVACQRSSRISRRGDSCQERARRQFWVCRSHGAGRVGNQRGQALDTANWRLSITADEQGRGLWARPKTRRAQVPAPRARPTSPARPAPPA